MAEKCENNYKWVSGYESEDISDEYEKLIRPDGTRVTVITEPEDRISYRDLAPITNELNSLQAENKRLAGEVKRLKASNEKVSDEVNSRLLGNKV